MNVKAYAKINLGLHIVGKRQDGFHDIETIFHRINLYDEINIENSEDISISCSNPSIPTDSGNLCWKAADLLRKESGKTNGARIEIKKNIPVGAGLGGGSSDAASVLTALNGLWKLSLDRSTLHRIALQLGSDVPFFLEHSSAYAEGRGERLLSIDLRLPYWIVLVNPNIHVSTPWAYKRLSDLRNGTFPQRQHLIERIGDAPVTGILNAENDFEEIVFAEHQKIRKIKLQLTELGAVLSLMSGSGSTMFGLFNDMVAALKAVQFFSTEYFVHMTEPLFIPERND
ncbi:MAG: 4-(cytidine 5'-diphospho)-2-C-methyl-D-erythritol kinase [Bacteroidota bacterium]